MRAYFILALVFGVIALSGCASTKEETKGESVSELPWNTPQKWEGGGGAMGGAGVGY
jgi:hypothetical protein